MRFEKIFKSLSGKISRDDLMEATDNVFKSLEEVVHITNLMPDEAALAMEHLPTLEKASRRFTGLRGNVLLHINATAKSRLAEKYKFKDYLESLYGPDVLKETFDYERINAIQLLNAMSWYSDFILDLMQTAAIHMAGIKPTKSDTLVEAETGDYRKVEALVAVTNSMQTSLEDLPKVFRGLRNISFNLDDQKSAEVIISGSSDPLKLGLVPVIGTFVYYLGIRYNRLVQQRTELRKQEILRLEQIITHRRRQMEGASEDELERLQKAIDYYSKTVDKLRAKVEVEMDR